MSDLPQRLKAVAVVFMLAGSAGAVTLRVIDQPPPQSELVITPISLSAKPCIHKPGKGEPTGIIQTGLVTLHLPSICSFSGCALPPQIEALRAGQKLTVWREGTTIWQIQTSSGDLPYSYSEAVQAHAAGVRRSMVTMGALVAIGFFLFTYVRRRNPL